MNTKLIFLVANTGSPRDCKTLMMVVGLVWSNVHGAMLAVA